MLALNPLYYMLCVLILSAIFTLFWDHAKTGALGIVSQDRCASQEELTLEEVKTYFQQPDIAVLLQDHKNFLATAVKTLEDNGFTIALAVYDADNGRPVRSHCYRVKKLARDLRHNFDDKDMMVVA